MTDTINSKFIVAFKDVDKSNLGIIVTKSDFIISDMVKALNYIEPAFYSKNNIFSFFQTIYKNTFIELVSHSLQNQETIKDSYGNLLVLL